MISLTCAAQPNPITPGVNAITSALSKAAPSSPAPASAMTYQDGSTELFCLACSEPCDYRVYRDYGWLERRPYGIIVASQCCTAPVVDENGWQYTAEDLESM